MWKLLTDHNRIRWYIGNNTLKGWCYLEKWKGTDCLLLYHSGSRFVNSKKSSSGILNQWDSRFLRKFLEGFTGPEKLYGGCVGEQCKISQ